MLATTMLQVGWIFAETLSAKPLWIVSTFNRLNWKLATTVL